MSHTADAARGKWRGILMALGVESRFLTGKHGPCPICGGKDRFRFDNKGGDGRFICSQCGSGNGFRLLELMNGWKFRQAAAEVDAVLGNVRKEPIKPAIDPDKRRKLLNQLWKSGVPVTVGDPVNRYLTGRRIDQLPEPSIIRFVASCPVPDEAGFRPAMVAMVSGCDGRPANLHRTFLGPNGKADMANPRAIMPGTLPEGSAVRLAPAGEKLGIAEGIETALKAGERFGMPVWSAINATMLAKFSVGIPESVRELHIFGDNDPKFGGQAAAFALAHKASCLRPELTVVPHIAPAPGTDWADD